MEDNKTPRVLQLFERDFLTSQGIQIQSKIAQALSYMLSKKVKIYYVA
jgi:hypothetical protein